MSSLHNESTPFLTPPPRADLTTSVGSPPTQIMFSSPLGSFDEDVSRIAPMEHLPDNIISFLKI